jgi:catechol 2,3-dioxygenase-like lactoylglutathione lyase family enzyme
MTIALRHDHVGITLEREHLDATIAWYAEKLDFTLEKQFSAHGSTFTFIANGEVRIELIAAGAEARNPLPENLPASHDVERQHHFCVAVDDLDAVLNQLDAQGVRSFAGPMQIDAIGQRIAFVLDPVGTIIELTTPA